VSLINFVITVVILWYFLRPNVKAAFKIQGSGV
jgi:F0F1-type ATP synthase membrane subunit b/b'